jgi:hypothetical protein
MLRWLRGLPVGITLGALALALSCHAKSYSQGGSDAGDDGDDDGGPCTCAFSSTDIIPCGGIGCASGLVYQCSDLGTILPTDETCGDASSDAPTTDEECVTTCTGQYCNVSDHCGGLCACAAGITCNPDGTCGNGCNLVAGDFCSNDAGPGGDGGEPACCAPGYDCLVHSTGIGTCCVIIGGAGKCLQNTDCCDYPAAVCTVATGTCNFPVQDAGADH